jgi:murein DD-endopeptidase MepM/ murein hydrolase activator NlpD
MPTPAPTLAPHPALTCPQGEQAPGWDTSQRSLYLLYAHMQDTSDHQLNDVVVCGELLGRVGQSGNALNPHLHLEARLGPSQARFEGMAHYDASASPEEMSAYCTWRVTDVFQLLDPMMLLSVPP